MAPSIPALAQSESKKRLFERLGFSEENAEHKRLYEMIKEEAVAGYDRLHSGNNTSRAGPRDGLVLRTVDANGSITETATHREILNIYRLARPETRAIYDRGHYTAGVEEENWIIRWALWHVRRYRRTNSRTPNSSPDDGSDSSSDGHGPGNGTPTADWLRQTPYDPVRDR